MKRLKFTKSGILLSVTMLLFLLWTSCTKSIIQEDLSMQQLVSPNVVPNVTVIPDCCDTPPSSGNCYAQTAFAKGGWIFATDKKSNPENLSTLGLTKNSWGWAINITTTGTTAYPIYAGAGLNDISKGTMVGTLSVSWDGSNVTVVYAMNNGFTLTDTHVYAGDTKPRTIAPGQYGHTESFDQPASDYTGTYNVSDNNGDGIWIIAHAGAFGCY